MPRRIAHLWISGRVQGVWYRGWAVQTAIALGLDGWVRNRRDGTVEAVAAGDAAQVESFIRACRDGPPAARVDAVQVQPAGTEPDPGFRQLPTP